MPRPKKLFRVLKHKRTDQKTGKVVGSVNWYIYFHDHLDIQRKVVGTVDKTTTEYIARNLAAIGSLRARNQPLTPELRSFVENQPRKTRDDLLAWGLLDASTNAS